MKNTVYENAEVAVMTFLSDLVERAIDPYSLEIKGNFKLQTLKKKLQKTLKDTVSLVNAWGYSSDEERMRDISLLCARRMCAQINKEVFSLFRENTEESFFLIDFNAYAYSISELLLKEFLKMENRNKNLALGY